MLIYKPHHGIPRTSHAKVSRCAYAATGPTGYAGTPSLAGFVVFERAVRVGIQQVGDLLEDLGILLHLFGERLVLLGNGSEKTRGVAQKLGGKLRMCRHGLISWFFEVVKLDSSEAQTHGIARLRREAGSIIFADKRRFDRLGQFGIFFEASLADSLSIG